MAHNAEALKDAMARMAQPPSGGGLDGTALDATAEAALSVIDTVKGGTHGAPKFPQPSFFRFLWRSYRRNRDIRLRDAVTTTLDAICQGGIYDHLGGGFARYSTDAEWLVPHFEKMLYDNAQILELLAEAWQETGTELYRIRARETVDWLIRDMRVWANGDGPGTGMPFGFASAFDADSEGVEGQYYIWGQADIEALLGDRARPFIDAYGVTPKGNWEGVNILNRSARPELGDGAYEAGLAESRATLLAEREKRVPPTRDDKVLADWNGLTIAALANAGAIFDEPEWIDLARRVFEFICRNHTVDGRLRHSWCAGSARHPAVLDDYANLSRAALALFQATGSETYLNQAEAWVAVLDRRYWDPEGGGYYLTADDSHDLITRPKTVADNAVPPGNGTMVEVLARLYQLTGNTAYRDRADALVRIFSGTEVGHQINMPSLFMGFEMLDKPVQIVVVGDPAAPDTLALVRAAQNGAPP
ncbi:MAG: thioredoxin domain-containing protein, partial [Rhodospirillales bacterium]|nr:thioredoxin domain-containing protein [Rhodospirillales bacterium]